jgi:hypothetical protein
MGKLLRHRSVRELPNSGLTEICSNRIIRKAESLF